MGADKERKEKEEYLLESLLKGQHRTMRTRILTRTAIGLNVKEDGHLLERVAHIGPATLSIRKEAVRVGLSRNVHAHRALTSEGEYRLILDEEGADIPTRLRATT
jgi:hypothetical protein